LLFWFARPRQPHPPATSASQSESLDAACQHSANWLEHRLGRTGHVLVCPPLVLAGDLSVAQLDRWERTILRPAAGAMHRAYFTREPDEPINVVLFATRSSYGRRAAGFLVSGGKQLSPHGFYQPHLRLIVANAADGPATVLHELTHAYGDFDFPNAPGWLREGLAALHEHARLEDLPPRLVGLPGPRLKTLQEAIRNQQMPSLASLLQTTDLADEQQSRYYAQARYFCFYLQQRGLLERAYRELRDGPHGNAADCQTILRLLQRQNWAEVDAEFQKFVLGLKA
jgi:hypothetical protein